MSQQKLSLWSALLININIILGAGVFINTVELAKRAGSLSPIAYIFIALLLLPLIFSMASLLHIYPDGGFYSFAAPTLGTFAGFFSTWSYFIGKLASATIMIHTGVLLLREIIPAIKAAPHHIADGAIVILFMFLNLYNMKTGSRIQAGFLVGKLIPLLFIILAGIILFTPTTLTINPSYITNFASTIPLVLYATIGFEATCSISRHIHNAQRNGPIILLTSYAIVILLLFLYQFFFYGTLGTSLSTLDNYLQAFSTFIKQITNNQHSISALSGLMYFCISISALGGAYAIMYSNMWNLYTLASKGHVFAKDLIIKTNAEGIPYFCVLFQGLIIMIYLVVTHGNQVPLQQTGALGVTISYAISVLSLLLYNIKRRHTILQLCISLLAMGSAGLLIQACILNFLTSGLDPLKLFISMLAIGSLMFIICNKKRDTYKKIRIPTHKY